MKRSELYELVWESPILTVSKDLQLSGVGLAKVCRRYSIPVPPRGYWAKLKAGKATKRIELPKMDEDEEIHIAARPATDVTPKPPDPAQERVRRAGQCAVQVEEPIAMPGDLNNAHSLIGATAAFCRQLPGIIAKYERIAPQHRWGSNVRQPPREDYGRMSYDQGNGLDVLAALDQMDWVLRFHHALFAVLTAQRVVFRREREDQRGGSRVFAELRGEKLYLSFSQGYSRKQIDASEYIKLRKQNSFASEYRYSAADRMTFKVEGTEYATRQAWTGSRKQLEGKLTEIANTCLRFFSAQPTARREREEAAQRARIREERAQRIRWRNSAQREQLDVGLKAAAAAESFETLERFLERVKGRVEMLSGVERLRAATWISVVEEQLRRSDPIEALLSTVADRAWSYSEPAWWPSPESEAAEEDAN